MAQQHLRPKRFVVIPKGGLSRPVLTASGARSRSRSLARFARLAGFPAPPARTTKDSAPVPVQVVNTSPPDGAVLVSAEGLSLEDIQARVPEGTKVFEEQWYRLDRRARPWLAGHAELKAPRVVAGKAVPWTVTVRLAHEKRTLVKDVLVTVVLDEARAIGMECKTDRFGRARFVLGKNVTRLDALYLSPLHSAWPLALHGLKLPAKGLELQVLPIDLGAADARGLVYGQPEAGAGEGVRVGVVDTGVGRHSALLVAGGRNTTEESPLRYRDEDGHGTHVAGVIASAAAGWRRGEASRVELRAYRVFQAGEEETSTFAISAAIKQAVVDGCDLVNLSIGGGLADGAVQDAIEQTWAKGCVCVAAAGNDGEPQVDYPARYPRCLGVSAIGLDDSWPAGADLGWTLSDTRGKPLSGRESFFASFSNHGKVALTAPGVAVVSTIFGNRWGAMSGTSMATPIATGVLARRLAASGVLAMPRDARRAEAIVALAAADAEDLGFTRSRQGDGLAR